MNTTKPAPSFLLLALLLAAPLGAAAQSVLVEAKTTAGDEVATIRTDSMRLLVPLHLLVGGLLFPDGTLQTTAAGGTTSVTSADIVDGTIVNADISASAAIADTKLATITSAGKVANGATTATASSTANAIVARDAAGGFSAGYVAVADSLRVGGEGSFLATGTYDFSGTTVLPPASGPGTRMMWYPEKAAFRAGYVAGTQWDASNIGAFSIAFGYNTTASGSYSTAMGLNTTASNGYATARGYSVTASGYASTALGFQTGATGDYSVALGNNTTASGNYSTALGYSTTAGGDYSTALGFHTTTSGHSPTALGYYTTASGDHSTALGNQTVASGAASIASGFGTTSSNIASTAFGYYTTANGNISTALGVYTTAQGFASVAIGRYNVIQGSATSWTATEPLFVAGNGSSASSPANALTLYKNGNLTIAGTLTQSSDARLKEDIEPLEGTLERVLRLTPIRYHFRAGIGRPGGTQLGLTAQQVAPLFPELVKQDGDGYLSLSYANLSAVLVKALQEQQAEIAPLLAEITSLKARLASSDARVARLEALVEQLVAAATSQRHPDDPQDPR